ncbi:Vta1 like-domain-containing protein [Phyllosticta citribraziliensis]|uniref:Vta1 like-domain-containing protein n=1 Tax=Phyllosticta citribraziliensis TaxID=989973 RepID=A0ABR1M000_9PEZI
MPPQIPAGLKPADISRFALRASQLEKIKPVIAYWCEYHVVNQIIGKGLHTNDEECMTYTTALMDKLERIKEQNPDNDAIMDEVAAKAYLEQFALETFQRADNTVRANKVTAQTADTFRAAATFLDLMAIWGPLEPEIAAKSKYAKYHALRIAKALKAGEDPNLSNPVRSPSPTLEEAPPALDPNDPEVQNINNGQSLQPTVEDAPPSFAPSPAPASDWPGPGEFAPPGPSNSGPFPPPPQHDVSPLDSPSRKGSTTSVGGGYFPTVPTFTSANAVPSLPTAPEQPMDTDTPMGSAPSAPPAPADPVASQPPASDPQDFYRSAPAPVSTTNHIPPAPSTAPSAPRDMPMGGVTPSIESAGSGAYKNDDDSILNAQKHAKWAISALNFEDVPTAVKELQIALQSLGAR